MDSERIESWLAAERLLDSIGRHEFGRQMDNLGRCLRDAGALCSAFSRGAIVGYDDAAEDEGYRRGEPSWTPGCGLPAPERSP